MTLPASIARRTFLARSGVSVGSMALASLLHGSAARGANHFMPSDMDLNVDGALGVLHHPPKAKRVIWLYMAGGMSHQVRHVQKETGQLRPLNHL